MCSRTFMSGMVFDDVIALLSINTTVSDDSVAVDLKTAVNYPYKGMNFIATKIILMCMVRVRRFTTVHA